MYLYVKRAFDVLFAFLLIFFLSPLFILVFLVSFFVFDGQCLFMQLRAGLNGKPFLLYKFRSMTSEVDRNGLLLSDYHRTTLYGSFLRSTSIDELPGLINVIRGEISFVGPRPLLLSYTPLYSRFQFTRLSVMPGITGLAQVMGRNSLTWQQRFKYDFFYVQKQSFFLDIVILCLTFFKTISREGINSSTTLTMSEFQGNFPNE